MCDHVILICSFKFGKELKLVFPLKIYGAAVTFFELLPEEQLTEERKEALKLNDDEVRTQFVMFFF